MVLIEEFYVFSIDLHRLYYGIITLIPKVIGASDIRQFRPDTVINLIFSILAKGFTNRVAPLADRITHPDKRHSSEIDTSWMGFWFSVSSFMKSVPSTSRMSS
ncbi:Signal recognition particle 54 kDa protein, chloroplastic [Hordeum vulgare]|nr:Signal recognition particle 54 kDa protein, chloroplastic [Hordeum vulgare]